MDNIQMNISMRKYFVVLFDDEFKQAPVSVYFIICRLRNITLIILLLFVIYWVAVVTFFYTKYEKSSTVSFHNEKMVYHGDAVTSNGEECAAIGM